jgi:hypothetical protein
LAHTPPGILLCLFVCNFVSIFFLSVFLFSVFVIVNSSSTHFIELESISSTEKGSSGYSLSLSALSFSIFVFFLFSIVFLKKIKNKK